MWLYWRLFLVGLGILGRRRRDLILENLILRQQLAVWERSGRRPRLQQRDRQFWSVTRLPDRDDARSNFRALQPLASPLRARQEGDSGETPGRSRRPRRLSSWVAS